MPSNTESTRIYHSQVIIVVHAGAHGWPMPHHVMTW